MNRNNKAAGCGDIQAAQQNNFSLNSNQIIETLKTACFLRASGLNKVEAVFVADKTNILGV